MFTFAQLVWSGFGRGRRRGERFRNIYPKRIVLVSFGELDYSDSFDCCIHYLTAAQNLKFDLG